MAANHQMTALYCISEPHFRGQRTEYGDDWNLPSLSQLLQSLGKNSGLNDSQSARSHLASERDGISPLRGKSGARSARDEGFLPSIQDFRRNDSGECSSHQRTALARANQLFPGYGIQELEKIPVEVRIALFVGRRGR